MESTNFDYYNALTILEQVFAVAYFYENGHEDRLNLSFVKECCDDSYYENLLECLHSVFESINVHFIEDEEQDLLVMRDPAMLRYFQLCREYELLTHVAHEDNPYVSNAQHHVERIFSGNYSCNAELRTAVTKERDCMFIFRSWPEFCLYASVVDAFFSVLSFFEDGIEPLGKEIELLTQEGAIAA
jgi:hypothetical protein